MDQGLLAQLDADPEVRDHGRSALLRRLAAEYLAAQKRRAIAEQYREAYADVTALQGDLSGWEEEGAWPEE